MLYNMTKSVFPLGDRFWSKVNKTESCWEWTANTNAAGYGQFSVKRSRSKLAHRLSFEDANGPIPDGKVICHHCDNPKCVRPEHLFCGTHADNIKDKVRKGRQHRGNRMKSAKLTPEQVLEIRMTRGEPSAELLQKYNISRAHVYRLRSGERWAHL